MVTYCKKKCLDQIFHGVIQKKKNCFHIWFLHSSAKQGLIRGYISRALLIRGSTLFSCAHATLEAALLVGQSVFWSVYCWRLGARNLWQLALFFVRTMFVRTLWLRILKNYKHAKNMAEIAKILRTFQPGGKYLKTFPKSIAFSANF